MLDDAEFALVRKAEKEGLDFVEEERKRRGLARMPPILSPDPGIRHFEGLQAMLEMYRLLTGYTATVMAQVYNHRISRHGPPCPECDKPLRSPRARYCVACGFGMDELPGDVPPLVERRSDAFPFLRPPPR